MGDDPQWERAHQSWELVVGHENGENRLFVAADGADPLDSAVLQGSLFRILRVKRSERESLLAGLPGVVRRGARVDLLALEQALREAGIVCVLRRRALEARPDPSE